MEGISPMSSKFRPVDRDTLYLLPPSVRDWLPEDHLARFVVEIVDRLDLGALERRYGGGGKDPYHPSLLLGLLFYGYATGVFSSRKLERATYDSVAFRFVAANAHPDHDTIASFRKRFLGGVAGLVRGDSVDRAGDGAAATGQCEPGRNEGAGEREQAQGAGLGIREAA